MSEPWERPLVDDVGQASPLGELVANWHGGLADDRAGCAALRRTTVAAEAFDAAPFLSLCARAIHRYPQTDPESLAERLAPIALTVAEIDRDDGRPPGRALAKPSARGKAFSEQRLRLLAGSDDLALFLRLLRGAVAQTGRSQSVLGTAELVRRWHMPAHVRERARRRLLLDYVAEASAT